MKLMVNEQASRLFRLSLLVLIGIPVFVLMALLLIFKLNMGQQALSSLLQLSSVYFAPVQALFGDTAIQTSNAGLSPRGILGIGATIVFYGALSYVTANIVATLRKSKENR